MAGLPGRAVRATRSIVTSQPARRRSTAAPIDPYPTMRTCLPCHRIAGGGIPSAIPLGQGEAGELAERGDDRADGPLGGRRGVRAAGVAQRDPGRHGGQHMIGAGRHELDDLQPGEARQEPLEGLPADPERHDEELHLLSRARHVLAAGPDVGVDAGGQRPGGPGRLGSQTVVMVKPELGAPVLRDQVHVIRVLGDPGLDVRAVRQDRQATGAGLVQHGAGELRGEAHALELVSDLGVQEAHGLAALVAVPAAGRLVLHQARPLAADVELEPRLRGVINDDGSVTAAPCSASLMIASLRDPGRPRLIAPWIGPAEPQAPAPTGTT